MKEKLEIRKTEKKAFYKNSFVDEMIKINKQSTIFRYFENETLSIAYINNDIDDEEGYFIASKNKKYPYSHTTMLNTQSNVIAKHSNIKEKEVADTVYKVGNELEKLSKDIEIEYKNVNIRYNLTNINKLHMNFEDEKNVFYIKLGEKKFKFEYRTLDIEKVVQDMELFLNPIIQKKYVKISEINEKNLIIPSDLNIYDFFEEYLTCKNVITNKLMNVEIFSEKLSLYTSLSPEDTKSGKYGMLPFFDWEGSYNPYYRNILIENGTVVKPYSNKDLAKEYEVENTCCSYAIKDDYPSCKLLGAYIQKGDYKLEDMVKSAIFIESADITLQKEELKFEVKRAYLYENGELTNIINPFSFFINAFRLFGNKFAGASKDLLFNSDLRRAIVFKDIQIF
ncbi:MAG: metallopeptidase TldD-related protein [Peptoanaerobacter stomatis]|uniref:metallopeptidase TldD-related protein n=1 Tax=Peptoanaerobacter stomatis TaxID=796937 RepID=UPI003FA15336